MKAMSSLRRRHRHKGSTASMAPAIRLAMIVEQ
jgi:hypothetical protein